MKLVDDTWVERAVSVIGRFACRITGDESQLANHDECCLVMAGLRAAPRVRPVGDGRQKSDLIERLLERAAAARREGTATAIGDAVHFEEAAAALVAHRQSERLGAEND